jgi:pantoate--beta-alanine ligase
MDIINNIATWQQPQRAYFGEKDYQQLQLVQGLAKAFFLSTEIIGCPILREPSGLPLSSRNSLLNPEEKILADNFAHIFHQPTLSCVDIIKQLTAAGISIDYIEDRALRRFAAVRVGRIRLIDNYLLK